MSHYNPVLVTLRLSPSFVQQLKQETEHAVLAQAAHTLIPSSLLQLATIVVGECTHASESRQKPSSDC